MAKKDTKKIIEQAEKRTQKKSVNDYKYLNSGSSILNLALTDNIDNGFRLGTISNIIGDESTGKTLFALTMIAEAIYGGVFKDYKFIYDDAESALSYDIGRYFGQKTLKELNIKTIEKKDNPSSVSVQDFQRNILKELEAGKPFIYVLDSLDALTSEEELSRYGKKFQDGASVDGSYKTEKAKLISEILRVIVSRISQTKSFLLILSQTRENIGFGAAFKPKVRSGGKALDFYSSSITWLSRLSQIKERDRKIGTNIGFKVSKNKNNGKLRDGKITLLNELGIDDVGSMCDYLVDENHWLKEGKKVVILDFDDPTSMFQKHIPAYIEDNNYTAKLKELCEATWLNVEESLNTGRKRRFE